MSYKASFEAGRMEVSSSSEPGKERNAKDKCLLVSMCPVFIILTPANNFFLLFLVRFFHRVISHRWGLMFYCVSPGPPFQCAPTIVHCSAEAEFPSPCVTIHTGLYGIHICFLTLQTGYDGAC